MRKDTYICLLDIEIQDAIRNQLEKKNFAENDIETAMDSRLCDIEEIVDVDELLSKSI